MQYTIHEAQLAYETYGTICVCDADAKIVGVFDDDEDYLIDWPIITLSYA